MRFRMLAGRWWRLWWRDNRQLIFNRGELARLLAFPIFVYVVAEQFGPAEMSSEVMKGLIAFYALVIPIGVMMAFNAAFALWQARKEDAQEGAWFETRRVFHEPKHLATKLVTAADNDRSTSIHVPAPVDTLVEFRIDVDRQDSRVKAMVARPVNSFPWEWVGPHTRMTMRLGRERKVYLHTLAAPEADPTTVRVYMLSWEVDPSSTANR